MPYICLANANVRDGAVQITDLWPNESQRNGSLDPAGQNRYLSRPATDLIGVDSVTGTAAGLGASANKFTQEGLAAYLVDRVEPGSGLVPETTVTLTGVLALDVLIIKGVYFKFAAGANSLAGKAGTLGDPFIVGLGANDAAAAVLLAAALNDNGDVAPAMGAKVPLLTTTRGTAPGGGVVRIQPEDNVAALVPGSSASFTVTASNAARMVIDATSLVVGRMVRSTEYWSAAKLAATVAALQNLVDTGLDATLSDIDALLLAQCGADLSSATNTNSHSTGTLAELLSIFAGRKYQVPNASVKFTAVTAPDTVNVWLDPALGSFTTQATVFDSAMDFGEWRPAARWVKHGKERQSVVSGGDTVNNEIGGVRTTVDSTRFQASLQTGQLSHLAAGINLFPDPEVQAFVSNWTRRTSRQAPLANQRVVTVYDDDGTLLA